jgi:hypothetical protein
MVFTTRYWLVWVSFIKTLYGVKLNLLKNYIVKFTLEFVQKPAVSLSLPSSSMKDLVCLKASKLVKPIRSK